MCNYREYSRIIFSEFHESDWKLDLCMVLGFKALALGERQPRWLYVCATVMRGCRVLPGHTSEICVATKRLSREGPKLVKLAEDQIIFLGEIYT